MKTTLVISVILLTMFCAIPAFSCPLKGETTGGACSVKDIKNLEKERMQEKVKFDLKREKNLRPVNIAPEITKPDESDCIFCIQETLFGKVKP